ncbi:hypothetical protein CIW68_07595 [Enterobacter cloacae]|uniref:hypothetical protein n=1 Tax=Enterobacter cloacae TaxID=550 RepID=UPI000BA844FC|nr:hypothetical protein [Enterobacter cloacae]PAN76312.1 hypothetical protein CIW68_07595 [Enterobacter cloacae]WNJ09375.1 hypothetical protein RIL75_21365 [Enterobacter cloacae]
MNIKKLLTGSRFQLLIQEGKQVERLIKNSGEALLKQSSPKQENALNLQWYWHSLPNPFPVGIILVLLVMLLVWGWSTIIYYFDLSVPTGAILCLSILPFMGVYLAFMPYTLGRGYASGLLLIHYFYLFDLLLTLIAFFLMVIKSAGLNEWMGQLDFLPLQLLIFYLCRYVMNSRSFYKTISFNRTTRMLVEAKKVREKLQNTK